MPWTIVDCSLHGYRFSRMRPTTPSSNRRTFKTSSSARLGETFNKPETVFGPCSTRTRRGRHEVSGNSLVREREHGGSCRMQILMG